MLLFKTLFTFQSAINLCKIKQSCIVDAYRCLLTVIKAIVSCLREKNNTEDILPANYFVLNVSLMEVKKHCMCSAVM